EARLVDLGDRLCRVAAGVERDERLAGLPVADELEAPEETEPAHLADRRVPALEVGERPAQVLPLRRRVLDDALLAEDSDRGDAGRARERMAAVGEPAGEELVLDRVVDVIAHRHRAERDV